MRRLPKHLALLAMAAAVVLTAPLCGGAPEDVNRDGTINILDVSIVSSCQGEDPASNEVCSAADVDLDGAIDMVDLSRVIEKFGMCIEGIPCETGEFGVCAEGATACLEGTTGAPSCESLLDASVEICDGQDNDCDGGTDEDFAVGDACATGLPGLCAAGALGCAADGTVECVAEPQGEVCDDGIDQDCNGADSPCSALTLTIDDPFDGSIVGGSPVTVRGTVNHVNARVAIGDVLATLTGNSFEATGISLVEGANQITARALNDGGVSAEAMVSVTLDSFPPVLALASPSDRMLVAVDTTAVTGTVSDATAVVCFVNGSAASLTDGELSTDAALAEGPNLVTVSCSDAAGNETSVVRTVFFDPTPLVVVSVDPVDQSTEVPPSAAVGVGFSEPVDADSVTATTLSLRSGSSVIPASVSVSSDGLQATLEPSADLPGGASIALVVSTGVSDGLGNPLAAPLTTSFRTAGAAAGAGLVIGEVYDDTRSLPLEGVSVEAFAPGTGQSLGSTLTDERGRYQFPSLDTGSLLRLGLSGFTAADRVVGTFENGLAEVVDARLTPLEDPTLVQALIGATQGDAAGNHLVVPPGSLASDGEVRLTAVSGQGLQKPLPPGWTPLAVAQVDGLSGLSTPAELTLRDRTGAAAGLEAVFARYDAGSLAWRLLATQILPQDGLGLLDTLTDSGQVALVVPDAGDGAPAIPAIGEPLPGAPTIGIPAGTVGSGEVTPAVGRADDPTPAEAQVTLVADGPLRSGTSLRGEFVELFLLRDGSELSPLNTSQDLWGYRMPGDLDGHSLRFEFPIAPSLTFPLAELDTGSVRVELDRLAESVLTVLGPAGGGVRAQSGGEVRLPPAALASPVPVALRRLGPESLSDLSASGLTAIGGLELDLAGAVANTALELTLEAVGPLVPTGATVLVAELRTLGTSTLPVLVAQAPLQGDALTTVANLDGVALPGVRTGGRYAFYRFDGPLVAVSGSIRELSGPTDGHIVRLEALPLVSVSGEAGSDAGGGRFVLASAPGAFALLATGASAGDELRVEGATEAALPDLVILPTPPRLELVTVRPPRVAGNFAGPVVLTGRSPPRVIDDGSGATSGNGDGVVDSGETVELYLSVRNDGTVPVEGGELSLRVEADVGDLIVAPESVPLPALPPDVPTEVGPFSFAVPAGADPASARYTLSHFNAGGLASTIPFGLPLAAEHLDVSVESEIVARFSEPVDASGLASGFLLEYVNGAGPELVATRLILGEGGTIATLRPLEALDGNSVYQVTLADTILDDEGRVLDQAPIVERFITEDDSPPTIDPGRIEASFPDADGFVHVTATLGTVAPGDSVIVLNETTGVSELATVSVDGSLVGKVRAEQSDQISLIVLDAAGNETRLPITQLVRRDPVDGHLQSVVMGRAGGSFVSEDGVGVSLGAGALRAATELSAALVGAPLALPPDIDSDPELSARFGECFTSVERVEVATDGPGFDAPIRVEVPAPPEAAVGDEYLVVRSRGVEIGGPLVDLDLFQGIPLADNPRATVERLEAVDVAVVEDQGGELVLVSRGTPPFPGVLEPTILTFLEVSCPITVISGEVRRGTVTGRVIPAALVAPDPDEDATRAFATLTGDDGRFVVPTAIDASALAAGDAVSARLDVNDPVRRRVIRRLARGTLEPPPPALRVAALDEPFVLPASLSGVPGLPDLEPPRVGIDFSAASLSVSGLHMEAGPPLFVRVVATDNEEVSFVSLSLNGVGAPLGVDGIFTTTPAAGDILLFTATAQDPSGNQGIASRILLVTEPGDPPPPPLPRDEPPFALGSPEDSRPTPAADDPDSDPSSRIDPPPEAVAIFGDRCIVVDVSEPLLPATVTYPDVDLLDPDGQPVDFDVSLTRGGTRIEVCPVRNLRLRATYDLVLSAGITDLAGQPFQAAGLLFWVPPPRLAAVIPVADQQSELFDNVSDIALMGNRLVVTTHPDGVSPEDTGKILIYDLVDPETGAIDVNPEPRGRIEDNLGRPLSLAVDGTRAIVGNRFLGPIARMQPLVTVTTPGDLASRSDVETILGCFPGDPLTLTPLCVGLSLVWDLMPRPASNIQVYELCDPGNPHRLGGTALNFVPPDTWNPNTWPDRVEVFPQSLPGGGERTSIGVLNFLQNVELFELGDTIEPADAFSRERVEVLANGVVGLTQEYASFQGRCGGGLRDGQMCLERPPIPGLPSISECLDTDCEVTTEFLDVAYSSQHVFALEADGVRVLDLSVVQSQSTDRRTITEPFIPFAGARTARTALLEDFVYEDSFGAQQVADLLFVSRRSHPFLILDVSDPVACEVPGACTLSESVDAYGNLSLDRERAIAYVSGPGGLFSVIDFRYPDEPIELNDPDVGEPFSLPGFGSGLSFNGNANGNGLAALTLDAGVAVVDVFRIPPPESANTMACDLRVWPSDPSVSVGNQLTLWVTGGTPPYSWEVLGGVGGTLQPNGAATSYTAGTTPGVIELIRVEDARGESRLAYVEVFEPKIQLEIVEVGIVDAFGSHRSVKTRISNDGRFTEDTQIRVTAMRGPGQPDRTFVGEVRLVEVGTSVYAQNGGELVSGSPTGVIRIGPDDFGRTVVTARSAAGPDGNGAPGAAEIGTSHPPLLGQPLKVEQWVDYAHIHHLADPNTIDWVEARAKDLFGSASGDFGTVLDSVSGYRARWLVNPLGQALLGETIRGHHPRTLIEINPFIPEMRTNGQLSVPECGQPRLRAFNYTLAHEARHAYQNNLATRDDIGSGVKLPGDTFGRNDHDQDTLVDFVPILPFTTLLDTQDLRLVCKEPRDHPASIVQRSYQGDLLGDGSPQGPDVVGWAREMDASIFGALHQ